MNNQHQTEHASQAERHWQPLLIKAAGLSCAVGYRLAAASCALRAGMDHFQESQFYDHAGEPIPAAFLPAEEMSGTPRLTWLAQCALADCAQVSGMIHSESTALFLLAAERERPHADAERYQQTFDAIQSLFSAPFHATSLIIPQGRAGIGDALHRANRLLQEGEVSQVLLLGVDSYLHAATIDACLKKNTLLTRSNAVGFIPGEAACAILLELARDESSGLHISGVGVAKEASQPQGGTPNQAIGLTQAMRQACAMAKIAPAELNFRISDQNGLAYFAKEASNACTRLMAEKSKHLPLLTIADSVGETGAAAGCIMLAYLSTIMEREDGPGFTGLAHLANDDGRRCALVLEQFC